MTDKRIAELDALLDEYAREGNSPTVGNAFVNAYRTWLRDAALRGLENPKGESSTYAKPETAAPTLVSPAGADLISREQAVKGCSEQYERRIASDSTTPMTDEYLSGYADGCDSCEQVVRALPAASPEPLERKTYDAVADAVQEIADAAAEAFRLAGVEPGEWDSDNIVQDVKRGIVTEIGHLGELLRTVRAKCASRYFSGFRDGKEASAKVCEPKMDEILMACGEMTAEQKRLVRAVLDWRARAIRALPEPKGEVK